VTKYVSTAIGTAITGAMGFAIWPVLWQTWGIIGGYMAAILVVPVMWYMNHRCGLIYNRDDAAWVDMAWGIALGGVVWSIVRRDMSVDIRQALPTLVCALIGGGMGGVAAEMVKRWHPSFQTAEAADSPEGQP
jgi:hypothetical protein